jgi:CBS domain containing-hemolysin-like protein
MNFVFGVLLILALTGFGVLLSLTEISFAAARMIRMHALAEEGNPRAARFVALRRETDRVITVIQIMLNADAVLGGIVADWLITPGLASLMIHWGLGPRARSVGAALSFCLITGLFVLFADLLPKRIALLAPERVALSVSWFPALALRLLSPLVWAFSRIADGILHLFRIPSATAISPDVVTPEDLRATLAGGTESGALLEQEHRLIENVLALQTRSVTSAMTPREDVVYLDLDESPEEQRDKVRRRPYSRYPLCNGGLDAVVGCVRAEDVLAVVVEDSSSALDLARVRRDVLSLPETLNLWETLAQFEAHGAGFAIVVSEYGVVIGVITFKDVMGALLHGLANPFEDRPIVKRDEDSWLIDGITPLPDVEHALDLEMLSPDGQYETVGGLVMHQLRRVPRKGDRVESSGFSFEVMSVEGFRINQLLVTRLPRTAGGAAETSPVRHITSAS